MFRMQQKEAELVLSRLKNEKKISKVINVMNAKNDQIENYIREKKYYKQSNLVNAVHFGIISI